MACFLPRNLELLSIWFIFAVAKVNKIMKYYIFPLVISMCILSCTSKDDHGHLFSVQSDTLYLDDEKYELNKDDNLDIACKWHGTYFIKLYCTFISVSENIKEIHQIEPPKGDPPYSEAELFVRNDSLMVTCTDGEHHYVETYNPQHNTWNRVYTLPDSSHTRVESIREDDNYKILFSDKGEFGGRLIFFDKKTEQEYFYAINCERVIKYQNDYYLICLDSIFKIHDPAQNNAELILSEDEYAYPNIAPCFVSAFIFSNELYIVANNQEETYIARLNGKNLEYVFGFGQLYDFRNGYEYNIVVNQFDDRVLLKYNRSESCPCGILNIEGNQIRMIFIDIF